MSKYKILLHKWSTLSTSKYVWCLLRTWAVQFMWYNDITHYNERESVSQVEIIPILAEWDAYNSASECVQV